MRVGYQDGIIYNCSASDTPEFAAGHAIASKHVPWMSNIKYGNYTVYFVVVVIFICMIHRIYSIFSDALYRHKRAKARAGIISSKISTASTDKVLEYEGESSSQSSSVAYSIPNSNPSSISAPVRKLVALIRFIGYRRFPAVLTEKTGWPTSVGSTLLLGAGFLYLLLWCFIPRSYYKACINFGSPPLALRAGLMANALTPFIYAFAGKINIITFFTGVSYEKLNVFHRGVAWISFFFAMVHTIPFLAQPAWEGGAKFLHQYFMETAQYASGVVALVFLFVLVIFSLKSIRDRFYETFLHVHWPVAIAYLGILFWHDTGSLESWSFLWTTIGILLSGYLYRYFYKTNYLQLRRNWFSLDDAVIRVLNERAVQINVFSSVINRWKPGQHVYLRFPEIQPIGNHPFSIASLPEIIDKTDGTAKLRFIVRPHGGFTKMLYEQAIKKHDKEYQVMLDGPYGGVERDLYSFDDVTLVASGSGATAIIPFLSDLAAKLGNSSGFPLATQKVRLLWVVRDLKDVEWFTNEISNALSMSPAGMVDVYIYITDEGSEKKNIEIDSPNFSITYGSRPDVRQLLTRWSQDFGRRSLIVTSGVRGLNCDVGNAVAQLQKLVLLGKTNNQGVKYEEINLHTEMFGW